MAAPFGPPGTPDIDRHSPDGVVPKRQDALWTRRWQVCREDTAMTQRRSVSRRKLPRQFACNRAVIDLLHVVDAGENHRGVELAAENVERARDACFAGGAEAIEERTADHAGVGAKRERAKNVLPGAHAGIE